MKTKTVSTGQIIFTDYIYPLFSEKRNFYEFISKCIKRHLAGDWGDLEEEDKESNNLALEENERLLSAYNLPDELIKDIYTNDTKIWIITEWDRSYTTVLFPSEY